jgi:uncharacterized membrane protein
MEKISTRFLSRCAALAALYLVVSVVFLPLSFGAVQVRVAESLALIPVISPIGIWGVTLGCALTNIWGVAAGVNILGPLDVFFGTGATFVAALLTQALRNRKFLGLPVAAAVPPILINALVIGAELTFVESGNFISWPLIGINIFYVGVGQFVSCGIIGISLIAVLRKTGLDERLFGQFGESDLPQIERN